MSARNKQDKQVDTVEMQPVDKLELAEINGGVGPHFDVTKVEGPKLPSWCLPIDPRLLLIIR